MTGLMKCSLKTDHWNSGQIMSPPRRRDTGGGNEASVETQSHDSRIGQVLEAEYSEESIRIATFLTTLQKPAGMNSKEYRNFKKKALHYTVLNHQLWKKRNKNLPMRLVVDAEGKKAEILRATHDELGHKGRESTYGRIST